MKKKPRAVIWACIASKMGQLRPLAALPSESGCGSGGDGVYRVVVVVEV
jgi:hypothetical protein